MKSTSLPHILRAITTFLIIVVIGATIFGVTLTLLMAAGLFDASQNQLVDRAFTITLPIQFVPSPDSYELSSATLGSGEIIRAAGTVAFEPLQLGSTGTVVEVIGAIFLIGAFLYSILLMLHRIFASMVEGSPFTTQNVRRIRLMAILVIGYYVFFQLIYVRIALALSASLETVGLQLSNQFDFNLAIPLLGLIIYSLAEVFRYGVELKSDSDLTI